jgi:signal recognition particle receptor subunit beta
MIPILILANKQDKPNAMPVDLIHKYLNIDSLAQKNVKIIPVSCKSGLNLDHALEWLAKQIIESAHHIGSYYQSVARVMNL